MTGSSGRVPDFVAIGHLTIDRTPEGDQLGGTVLYAALAAARSGARAAVLTRANLPALAPALRDELDAFASEVEIIAQASDDTTTFTNRDIAGRRSQLLHAWGGEIDLSGLPPLWRSAQAIHIAPVAQEIDARQLLRLSPQLLGCTPQGWMRSWDRDRLGAVRMTALRLPPDVVARIDVMVISSEESVSARDVLDMVGQSGLAVVTRGEQGVGLIDRGRRVDLEAFPARVVETIGAGDVFAGALISERAERQPVVASARYASAAAALKVTGRGIRSVPNRDAILQVIEYARGRV